MLQNVHRFSEKRYYGPGDVIFQTGDPPDAIYFLRAGEVALMVAEADEHSADSPDMSEALQLAVQRSVTSLQGLVRRRKAGKAMLSPREARDAEERCEERTLLQMRPRALFGSSEFFMRQDRKVTARCCGSVAVYRFSRAAMNAMQLQDPALAKLLHMAVIQSLSQTLQVHFVGQARKLHAPRR